VSGLRLVIMGSRQLLLENTDFEQRVSNRIRGQPPKTHTVRQTHTGYFQQAAKVFVLVCNHYDKGTTTV
jgi:hypothetical protein